MNERTCCQFNFDPCCVKLKYTAGSMFEIATIAVENQVTRNMCERSALNI